MQLHDTHNDPLSPSSSQPFEADSIESLRADHAFEEAARVKRQLEEAKEAPDTPTGRRPKVAKEADALEQQIKLIRGTLDGLNTLLASRWPELEYRPDELDVIATLAGPVMQKNLDLAVDKYGEEIALLVYVGSTGAHKGTKLYQRLKRERLEREEEERKAAEEEPAGLNEADLEDTVYRRAG